MTTDDDDPPPPQMGGAARTGGAGRVGRRVAAGARGTARGLVAGAGFSGRQVRRGVGRVFGFTGGGGATASGLARLIHLQFLVGAGDAAVAVSLAGTLFFALPTDQARPQVAQFLLLTMAPFAVVAPLIGPVLDRFRHGRRWAVGTTLALRAFLCWVLADAVARASPWLFLCALCCLVASKAFTVSRASAVPRLLPDDYTLVTANSRISMANVIGAAVGGGIAAAIARAGAPWSLRFAFLVFVVATVTAIRLSPRIDSAAGEQDIGGLLALPPAPGDEAPSQRIQRRFRSLKPSVLHGLRCAMGARFMSGFLTLFLAFLLRDQPTAHLQGTVLLGVVVAAAGVGNSVGTVVGNLLKRVAPERIAIVVLAVDALLAVGTAILYSTVTVILLGFGAGMCAQLAKLSYDALVQRDVAEVVRTSVFARSEAILQMSWVFGGALGIGLPLFAPLGFGIAAALLLGVLAWNVVALRRRIAPPRPTAPESVGRPTGVS